MLAAEFVIPVIDNPEHILLPDVWLLLTFAFVGFQNIFAIAVHPNRLVNFAPAVCPGSLSAKPFETSFSALHSTRGMQFERMVAIVEASRVRTLAAAGHQQAAREKLDAIDYAMHIMRKELSTVMPQFAISSPSIQTDIHTDNVCHPLRNWPIDLDKSIVAAA